jgi:hypothetical protein
LARRRKGNLSEVHDLLGRKGLQLDSVCLVGGAGCGGEARSFLLGAGREDHGGGPFIPRSARHHSVLHVLEWGASGGHIAFGRGVDDVFLACGGEGWDDVGASVSIAQKRVPIKCSIPCRAWVRVRWERGGKGGWFFEFIIRNRFFQSKYELVPRKLIEADCGRP